MNVLYENHHNAIKKRSWLSFLALFMIAICTGCTANESVPDNGSIPTKSTHLDTVTIPGLIGVDFKDMDTTYLNEIKVSPGLIGVIHDPVELQDFYSSSNTLYGMKKVSSPQEAYKQLVKLDTGLVSKIDYWTAFDGHYVFSTIPQSESETSWNFSFFAIYYIQKGDSIYRFVTFK